MFDLNSPIFDDYGDELDGDRLNDYIDGLMEEFSESPEAAAFSEAFDRPVYWAATYMKYAGEYLCETPATMTARDSREILFDLFPRKVSVEADQAGEIIAELRAFWQFLKRTRSLEQADEILDMLTDEDADRLKAMLDDSSNYGTAKSFFMMGKEAGYDMTTQEGLEAFALVYNAQLAAARGPAPREQDDADDPDESFLSVAPIQSEMPRVGRNDPCPCGSGRKYKKCCGVG